MISIKEQEQIIDLIRQDGYDLITAQNIWKDALKRFKSDSRKKARYFVGNVSFTLNKL